MDDCRTMDVLNGFLPAKAYKYLAFGQECMKYRSYMFAKESFSAAYEEICKNNIPLTVESAEVYVWFSKSIFLTNKYSSIINDEIEALKQTGAMSGTASASTALSEMSLEQKQSDAEYDCPEGCPFKETVIDKMESTCETNEIENCELAVILLETAMPIFQKLDTIEAHLKVAEILQLLANLTTLDEDDPETVEIDLQECISIRCKYLKEDDVCLGDTYIELADVLISLQKYDEALSNFKNAATVFKLRRQNLEALLSKDGIGINGEIECGLHMTAEKLLEIEEKIESITKEKELESAVGPAPIIALDRPGQVNMLIVQAK